MNNLIYTRDEAYKDMCAAQRNKIVIKFKNLFDEIKYAATSGYDHIRYEVKSIRDGYDLIAGLSKMGYKIYINENGAKAPTYTIKSELWFKYSYEIEIWWI